MFVNYPRSNERQVTFEKTNLKDFPYFFYIELLTQNPAHLLSLKSKVLALDEILSLSANLKEVHLCASFINEKTYSPIGPVQIFPLNPSILSEISLDHPEKFDHGFLRKLSCCPESVYFNLSAYGDYQIFYKPRPIH